MHVRSADRTWCPRDPGRGPLCPWMPYCDGRYSCSWRRVDGTVETVRAADRSTPAVPSRRAPLRDQVVADVRRLILENTLAPGQPLREEHLAQLLGVSRGPIREALIELEREGLAR